MLMVVCLVWLDRCGSVSRDAFGMLMQEYWRRTSNGKWCGGKHLADSASYTSGFCKALLQCWLGCLMKTEFYGQCIVEVYILEG